MVEVIGETPGKAAEEVLRLLRDPETHPEWTFYVIEAHRDQGIDWVDRGYIKVKAALREDDQGVRRIANYASANEVNWMTRTDEGAVTKHVYRHIVDGAGGRFDLQSSVVYSSPRISESRLPVPIRLPGRFKTIHEAMLRLREEAEAAESSKAWQLRWESSLCFELFKEVEQSRPG